MKRRPLLWTGVCLVMLLACFLWSGGGHSLPRGRTGPDSIPEDGSTLRLTGQIADCDLQPEGMRLFLNNIKISSINNSEIIETSLDSKYQILFYTDQKNILPGDCMTVQGVCSTFSSAVNPGQFDALEYYSGRNVLFSLKKAEILEYCIPGRTDAVTLWRRALFSLKHQLCQSYQKVLGEEQAAALAAITLGEKQMLEQGQKQLYQEGGISHILAVSGLHISLLGMGLYRLLRRCYVPRPVSALVSGGVLVSYIEMVGWSASSARACIMFLIWLGAELAGRAYDRLTALSAAAVCILIRRPDWLLESAFQLSFLAILSLSTLSEYLPEWLGSRSRAGRTYLGAAGLQLGMLPCTLYFFYQIPPWSILLNLAVVTLMPLIMGFGMLGGIFGMFSSPAGTFLAAPCHYLLSAITGLCLWEQQLPWNITVCGRPGVQRIVVYYGMLAAAAAVSFLLRVHQTKEGKLQPRRPVGLTRFLWLCVFFICWILMQPQAPSGLEVTCLDVGQGDGILLRMPSGEVCMIDGGSTSESKVWNYRISQTVKYYGVREIDWWFVSHSDSDHISGLREYLCAYRENSVGQNGKGVTLRHLVLPVTEEKDETLEELRYLAEKNGIAVHTMAAGDDVGSGRGNGSSLPDGWSLMSLAPDPAGMTGDKNQDSLVLLLQYGRFRMMFTGDLEKEGEKKLLEREEWMDVDVLKVGHHGSRYASSEAFLARTAPEAAVISCAAVNRYGHPSLETLERLQAAGCRTVCTAQTGAVQIMSDGEEYRFVFYGGENN